MSSTELLDWETEITIEVISFEAEYADCGSHRIKLQIELEKAELERLIAELTKDTK